MTSKPSQFKVNWKMIDWPVTLFLTILPVVAIVTAIFHLVTTGWSWPIFIFTLIFAGATNLSITAGYHRLFAHRSYEASWLVRLIYILVGSSAWQGSVKRWAIGHRYHHSYEDTEKDPYNINNGFWYAHMGWMFIRHPNIEKAHAVDLDRDPMVHFQHRFYLPIAMLTSFGFPTLIGAWMGDAWGGLIWGGFVRVFLTQQSTYFINSLCHYWGKRPFEDGITARDSLILAFLTHGEGYHNFHHKFQSDYRNGYRWYQWDPTKWIIWFLAACGLAGKLKRIPQTEILKARLQMDELVLKSKGYSQDKLENAKNRILQAQLRLKKLKDDSKLMRQQWSDQSRERLQLIRAEMKQTRAELKFALATWRLYLKSSVAS